MTFTESSYFNFMADLDVPFFHWGGSGATKRLLEMCEVREGSEVLVVGCGTGYSSCFIAEEFGCKVVGIDLADGMVAKARQRARERKLEDRAQFRVANALSLPFDDETFDIVVSEFTTTFMDKANAFKEYARVLKPGGYVGINELSKSDDTPDKAKAILEKAETDFAAAVGLPFAIPFQSEWETYFDQAGLRGLQRGKMVEKYTLREFARAEGGWLELVRLMVKVSYHMITNSMMRPRLKKVKKLKRALMTNPKTKKWVSAELCVGKKTDK